MIIARDGCCGSMLGRMIEGDRRLSVHNVSPYITYQPEKTVILRWRTQEVEVNGKQNVSRCNEEHLKQHSLRVTTAQKHRRAKPPRNHQKRKVKSSVISGIRQSFKYSIHGGFEVTTGV